MAAERHAAGLPVIREIPDLIGPRPHARDHDRARPQRRQPLGKHAQIGLIVPVAAVFRIGKQRSLRDIRRDDVRVGDQRAERAAHPIVEIRIIAAVVRHGGVNDHMELRAAQHPNDLAHRLRLIRRCKIS